MSLGFLRAAFRPDGEVCQLRAVARLRETLLTEQASWVQRMQKALVQMNIQLTEVLSDVMGLSGSLMIRDIVAGQRNPKALARHRHGRVKASPQEIIKALTGNWREEHLFVLRQSLGMHDDMARHLAECDTKLAKRSWQIWVRKRLIWESSHALEANNAKISICARYWPTGLE